MKHKEHYITAIFFMFLIIIGASAIMVGCSSIKDIKAKQNAEPPRIVTSEQDIATPKEVVTQTPTPQTIPPKIPDVVKTASSSVELKASPPKADYEKEIMAVAVNLKADDINTTIKNVKEFTSFYLSYKFYEMPNDLKTIWTTKQGDCTDQAYLMRTLLEDIYSDSLHLSYVYGYCDSAKHDWLVLPDDVPIDNFNCTRRDVVGRDGVW
jgi:hypothetical protein